MEHHRTRRVRALLRGALGTLLLAAALPAPAGELVRVYKSPSCGCCQAWVEHLQANGFEVQVEDTGQMAAIKQAYGIPSGLRSCHTAQVGEYLLEGHVPAADVQRLLADRPKLLGLAVPGMPVGSPGMEQGDRRDPYQVISFDADGRFAVFAQH